MRLERNIKRDLQPEKESKHFHQYISNYTKCKSKVRPLKDIEDNKEVQILDDDTEIVHALNETFWSVFDSVYNITELLLQKNPIAALHFLA